MVALVAARARALSPGGGVAAVLVGASSVAAGWGWAMLLIAFFLTSSALSRIGAATKVERTAGLVEKSGPRDAAQVFANGGIFAGAALLYLESGWLGSLAAGAGALAAATADTWATEIGTLAGRRARLITTWRDVAPGTSGGVSLPGALAALGGASLIAGLVVAAGWPFRVAVAAGVGGLAGAAADSVAGALWQARRYCRRCGASTERIVHSCGAPTEHAGGARWLGNDGINLLGSAVGAAVALLWYR